MAFTWLIVATTLLSVAGCASNQKRPDFRTSASAFPPLTESGQVDQPERWWAEFGDPGLNQQVNKALGESFDLAAALQRLRAAQALTRREASDLFPDVNGVIGSSNSFGPGPNQHRINWGLDASYQVDLWGQIQSRVDAERFRAEATREDYHAVALALAAEVSRTWFALIESYAQLELLDEQVATNRNGLKAQEARWGSGDEGGSPDVLRQRQLVEATLEQAVVVKARVEVLEHQLAVLTGQPPQTASYSPGAQLPALPPMPYTGLPSELLKRRPDVRADYLAFVAADRDLASAITAQYPRLDLTSSLINSAENPGTLFKDWFYSIGAQLVAPLLDGGERRAEVDRRRALLCQRFNEYGQTMLIALQEVEDGLALERYQLERIERLEAQVGWANKASEQLRRRYYVGEGSYLDILSASQSQQRLQREILSARLDLVLIRIGLYSALAGGFNPLPEATQLPSDIPQVPSGVELEQFSPAPEGVEPITVESAGELFNATEVPARNSPAVEPALELFINEQRQPKTPRT
ncbi:MAG: efflux transporter outer membrane subunit [Aureliella sp.]